jgi:hypothetical protein
MDPIIKNFAGVELQITPECVRGTVTKEKAIEALADAAAKAILKGNFREFHETTLWARAINLNYEQIEKQQEEEKKEDDVLSKIADILANAPVTEETKILDIIVKSFQQKCFSEVLNIACTHDSPSWQISFEEAERELLD